MEDEVIRVTSDTGRLGVYPTWVLDVLSPVALVVYLRRLDRYADDEVWDGDSVEPDVLEELLSKRVVCRDGDGYRCCMFRPTVEPTLPFRG